MKFLVTMKDPDGADSSIERAAGQYACEVENLDEEDRDDLAASKRERLGEWLSRWLKHGEYITIEFDTEANTARVVPVRET